MPGRTNINNIAASTPSVIAADRFSYEWQSRTNVPAGIVVAGTDIFAVRPVPTTETSVMLVLVANAPIPTEDDQDLQLPRDILDAILDEAEHLAQFKRGSQSLMATMGLHESFMATCERWRSRIAVSGIFPSEIRPQTPRGQELAPRFASTKE